MVQQEGALAAASDPALCDVLTNERRRHVLAALRAAGEPLALADLAADVVALEADAPAGPDWEAIQRCYAMLYHNHVPRLVDAGLVASDGDNVVRLVD